MPRRPMRNRVLRSDDWTWDEFHRIAAARDEVGSEELRKFMAAYIKRHGKDHPPESHPT